MSEKRTLGLSALVHVWHRSSNVALALGFALIIFSCARNSHRDVADEPSAYTNATIVAPMTAWTWPLYIAKEGRYYQKYGLDVNLIFANHPSGIALLTSQQADVNLLPLQRALEVTSKDDSFVVIGGPVGKWLFALIARNGIEDIRHLRGKRLGVAQLGDSTHNFAIKLLEEFGLTSADVQIVVVGAEGRVPALTSGRIDATMLSAPGYFALQKMGYRTLANISEHSRIQTPSVFLLKKQVVQNKPQLLPSLIRSHADAVKRFYDDKAFAIRAHRLFDSQDEKGLMEVYDAYVSTQAFERIPYILSNQIQYVVDSNSDPLLKRQMERFDFRTVVENRVVGQLVRDGFFRQLFGDQIAAEEQRKEPRAF
jgi:ABC-type nitrate/sulfonate/bicarbonate transport system substrate-binding protein